MKKVIIGIDPGTTKTGYGVLEVDERGKLYAVALGDIDLHKVGDTYQKLHIIFERVSQLIDGYKPVEMALEAPFFGKDPQSMLKLGRAQGVAMAAALSRGIPVWEYSPRRVKQAVTGNGAAAKEQVAALMGGMLGIEYDPRRLDATDGMAVALCHHFTSSSPISRAAAESAGSRSASSTGAVGGSAGGSAGGAVGGSGSSTAATSKRKKPVSWETFLRQNPDRVM